MKITTYFTHRNAEELISDQNPLLFQEVKELIASVDASAARTKVDSHHPGKLLYDRKKLGVAFDAEFLHRNWKSARCSYYVTLNPSLLPKLITLPAAQQKELLARHGERDPLYRFAESDYLKEKVTAEVQFGNHPRVITDLYMKHALFHSSGQCIAGIEILPMRKFQQEMSSSVASYEAEVYLLMRSGNDSPCTPLLILGVEP